jgi:hypothetical protein
MEEIYIRLQSLEESPELHQYTQRTDHESYQSTAPIKLELPVRLLQQVSGCWTATRTSRRPRCRAQPSRRCCC